MSKRGPSQEVVFLRELVQRLVGELAVMRPAPPIPVAVEVLGDVTPIPVEVRNALVSIAEPGTAEYRQLTDTARGLLAQGFNADEAAARMLRGEDVDL